MPIPIATLMLVLVIGLPAPSQTTSETLDEAQQKRASEPWLSGTVVIWPAAAQPQLVVVESPGGDQLREMFEPWERPLLDLSELPVLLDGNYQYSHRLLPTEEGERPILRGGSFRVLGGRLQAVEPELAKHPSGLHRESQPLTESSSAPFLWLNDTSPNGSGTDDNWWIWADGNGNEEFSIFWDPDHGSSGTFTEPFRIERGVNDYALYIDGGVGLSTAQIGVNTNTPTAPLHLVAGLPSIRFEQVGLQSQTWELFAREIGVLLFDWTSGRVPFVIETGTPDHQLYVQQSGRVGIGTGLPQGNLHIFGQPDADVFSGVGPNLLQGPAFNFGYSGSSYGLGSGFFNARSAAGAIAPNPALYFMTNNVERLMVDRDGDIAVDMDNTFGNSFDPQHPIHAQQSGAYLSASGMWRDASSRALKDHIAPLGLDAALLALAALEPVTYVYKAEPEDEVVGFIAEDVPELVATPDRKTLAPTDIVGVLTKVLQEQQRVAQEQQRLVLEQQRELEEQGRELMQMRREIAELRSRVE